MDLEGGSSIGDRQKPAREGQRRDRLRSRDAALRELVELIAKALVNEPDAVAVKETAGNGSSVVLLKVAAGDLGKVIGRQGKTARSLRTIVAAAGAKFRKRIVLEIVE